jgi:TonB-dependent starch-binding outer membrane protein SusC
MVKLKLKSTIVLMMCMFFWSAYTFSQRTITGVVTDADNGEPLIGVNILVVGTSTGTISDIDGTYSIALEPGATQLQFSYTGYSTQTITVGAANVLDVTLRAGAVLNEVVVIGYGTVKREDATGSVSTVDTKNFNRGAITGPQELLAGKIAGVQITTDGTPGGGAQIRIRGGSSMEFRSTTDRFLANATFLTSSTRTILKHLPS